MASEVPRDILHLCLQNDFSAHLFGVALYCSRTFIIEYYPINFENKLSGLKEGKMGIIKSR